MKNQLMNLSCNVDACLENSSATNPFKNSQYSNIYLFTVYLSLVFYLEYILLAILNFDRARGSYMTYSKHIFSAGSLKRVLIFSTLM